MKNYETILTEKQQKYQHYCQVKLINVNEYLTGDAILQSYQSSIIVQAKFTYCPLGKAFEKQIKSIEELEKNKLKLQKF